MKMLAIITAALLAGCAQTQYSTDMNGEKREYVTNESLEDAFYRLTNPREDKSLCSNTSVLRSNLYPQRQEFVVSWGGTTSFQDFTQASVRGYRISDSKTRLVYSTAAPTAIVRDGFAACIQR